MAGRSCGPIDVGCHIQNALDLILETWTREVSLFGTGILSWAFDSDGSKLSTNAWTVATTMTSRWAMILLVVVVGLGAWQILVAIIQGNTRIAVSGFIWALLAWPTTLVAVYLAIRITKVSDTISSGIIKGDGRDSLYSAFQQMYNTVGVFENLRSIATLNVDPTKTAMNYTADSILLSLVLVVLLAFASFLLAMVMTFRNYALVVLIGFAPLAFMALPVASMRGWIGKWAQAVFALIIAKPLAAGILIMAFDMFGDGTSGIMSYLSGIVAITMSLFTPVIAMKMFSFIGADSAAAYGSHSSAIVNSAAQGAVRTGSRAVDTAKSAAAAVAA